MKLSETEYSAQHNKMPSNEIELMITYEKSPDTLVVKFKPEDKIADILKHAEKKFEMQENNLCLYSEANNKLYADINKTLSEYDIKNGDNIVIKKI